MPSGTEMPLTFPIVGIGASAGGIEALEGFFRGMPAQPGLGFVVVTHLSPDRPSFLHDIIQRFTPLPVQTAVDGAVVERDNIYVMPQGSVLLIERGRLKFALPTIHRERKPIDVFFSALGMDQGECSVGVVLSGGDGDGTLGLKAIKEQGGLTLAQAMDGFGPRHPDMPDAAISSGLVDFAIPVQDMGEKLVAFAKSTALLGRLAADADGDPGESEIAGALPALYNLLRGQVGHDFSGYKTRTFIRRVQRRMQVTQLSTVDAYIDKLRHHPTEVALLFRDLLINVTSFFRDGEAFEKLAEVVIPLLFQGRGADDTVRIWVPGCATGEEVYSLAILIREHTEQLSGVPRVQIFATDIDERALSVARTARYPLPLLESVSEERRSKYFVPDGNSLVVSREVRELCIFSPHSVIRDPPFSRIDLVSCRNLLIYFGPEVQSQVIPTFHYALRPEGFLFLGSAENVSQFDDLFVGVEKRNRIFRRRTDAGAPRRLPLRLDALRTAQFNDMMPRRAQLSGASLRQAVDNQMLERHSPPHVVVNLEGDVMYYSGRTGKYLEAPAGAPTRQLQTMARKDLRLDLRTLFREAVETGRPAIRDSVPVSTDDGRVQLVSIAIEPISGPDASSQLFLVLFSDQGPLLSREDALERASLNHHGNALNAERELRDTRDLLQSMIEEYETALEELKSSNEELVSLNEEMQSTNEELEASKEELQSVNEELQTVNAELHGKVEALDQANSDLLNLFDSTDVATIFLDRELVIRSFTPAVSRVFAIRPGDRGRPLTDLSARIELGNLAADILLVSEGHPPIERRADGQGATANYLIRIAPYRTGNNKIEGVVVTFIEVSLLMKPVDASC